MKAEHPRLEEVFREALEAPSEEARNLLISRACAGDLSLRRRVEALIRAHESAGTFLDPGFRLVQEVAGKTITAEGDTIRAGWQIGGLRVLERVAEGGLCVVYLAEQLVPVRRPVALKVLKSGADAQLARAHFEGERQAMAVLDHPNIVQVYNAGTTSDGLPYLVMEWIQGPTVCRYADDAQLSLRERLSLFLQVCAAISHAHAHGVIHCDLKPANILVPEFDGVPVPKLIDFGIAGDLWARRLATARMPGEPYLKGTPAYMSPEQAFGGAEEIDGRTDVFSLGAVLHELLTGLSPFEGETGKSHDPDEVKRIIKSRQWRLPSARVAENKSSMMSQLAAWRGLSPMRLASALRGDLDTILAKALAFNRDHRYATVSDLAADLRRFQGHREVSVRPLGWCGRSSRFVRRHQAVMASGGVITGILLGAGLNTVVQRLKSRTLERRLEHQESTTGLARRQAAEAQSQRLVALGVDAMNHGDVAEAMSWLGAAAQLAAPGSREQIDQVRRVATLAAHVALPIRGLKLSGSLRWLEFSADDHYLTAVDSDGLCTVWDWQADVVLPWSQEMGSVTSVDWSPQGSQLAAGLERGRVEIRSVPSGAVVHRLDTDGQIGAVRFSPDGRLLAIGGQTLRLWDMGRGQWCDWSFPHPAPIFGLSYSADGRRLASACLDRMARVFDLGDGLSTPKEPVASFPHERGFAQVETDRCCEHSLIVTDLVVPLFIGRGDVLLTWTAVGQLTSWDIAAGNVLGTVEGTCFSTRLVASPEGGYVGIAIQRGAAEFRPASDFLGTPAMRLEHRERICDLAFGPENDWVLSVSADRTARLWSLLRATPLLAPVKHSAAVVHGVASRQGEWIGTAQLDGLVRVWRLPLIERNTRRLSMESVGPWRILRTPDDQTFVLCQRGLSRSRVAMVLSVEPNRAPVTRIELTGEFRDAVWSSAGDFLAILTAAANPGSLPASGRIELRRASTLNEIEREVRLPFLPVHLAWHPGDDRFLVSDADGGLWFVHLDEPTQILPFTSHLDPDRHREEGLEFADGGRCIVRWWAAGGVEVRNVEQGKVPFDLGAMAEKSRLTTLSPDRSELLLTDSEGMSILLSLGKPGGIRRVLKHAGGTVAQGFSPDGQWIATSGHDRRVLVWDRLTSELVCPPLVHDDEVFDFEFSQDGSWLAAACRDGRFHVWDTRSGTALLPVWSGDESLYSVKLVAQGRWAVLAGLGSKIWLRDLSGLQESTDWSLKEMILLTEVVSGRAVDADPAASMSSEEWLERMSLLHRLRPSIFQP